MQQVNDHLVCAQQSSQSSELADVLKCVARSCCKFECHVNVGAGLPPLTKSDTRCYLNVCAYVELFGVWVFPIRAFTTSPLSLSASSGARGSACLSVSSSILGHSINLEQAIVRLGLCMFEFGGMRISSYGRFAPHLCCTSMCLIPSMHA